MGKSDMPWVTRSRERVQTNQSESLVARAVHFCLDHPTVIVAILSALAYIVGFLLLVQYSDALGIPMSSFGLEFRDFVLLSLLSLALILVSIGTFAGYATILDRSTSSSLARRRELKLERARLARQGVGAASWPRAWVTFRVVGRWLWTAAVWTLPLLVLSWFFRGSLAQREAGVFLALLYALLGVAGAIMSAWFLNIARDMENTTAAAAKRRTYAQSGALPQAELKVRRSEDRRGLDPSAIAKLIRRLGAIAVVGLFAYLAVATMWIFPGALSRDAADSIRSGTPASTTTALDLVIRPQTVEVTHDNPVGRDHLATLRLRPGDTVILISDRGGQAVMADPRLGNVIVTSSADLSFTSPPPDWRIAAREFLESIISADVCDAGDFAGGAGEEEADATDQLREVLSEDRFTNWRQRLGIPGAVTNEEILEAAGALIVDICTKR